MQADFFFLGAPTNQSTAPRCQMWIFFIILASFHVRKQLQENKNLHKLKEKIYIFFKYIC